MEETRRAAASPLSEPPGQHKSLKYTASVSEEAAAALNDVPAGLPMNRSTNRLQNWTRRIRAGLAAACGLLYPRRCVSCQTPLVPDSSSDAGNGPTFCPGCRRMIHAVRPPQCLCCGLPFAAPHGPNSLCQACRERPPAFRKARACATYRTHSDAPQPLRDSLLRFKYARDLRAGKALAALAAQHFPLADEQYDCLIPVPLHVQRLRWRGFNQSTLLARAVARRTDTPLTPWLLHRIRPTPAQTKLTRAERRANVRGAFQAEVSAALEDRHVLLVDDVFTSGATVEECAHTLYQNGARSVDVFTLARVIQA